MEKNINFNYKNLSPFKWFVLENFPFLEADFDALTEWQLFCKLGKEINKIINSVNLSGEQVEKLTTAFNDLQNYVNNYFDNLDVQEEINNKLNEMAESGELEEIISVFLTMNSPIVFDNVSSMVSSKILQSGSTAQTLGYYTPSDGGGGLYKIETYTNQTIDNGEYIQISETLVAHLILLNNIINVKCFGAKGDNSTDDTTALQNAVNYANNHRPSIVYSPSGQNYKVTGAINFTRSYVGFDFSNSTITGYGNINVINIGNHDTETKPPYGQQIYYAKFKNLLVRANDTNVKIGIFANAPWCEFENIEVRGDVQGTRKFSTAGFYLTESWDAYIHNCTATDISGVGFYSPWAGNNQTFERCTVQRCNNHCFDVRVALSVTFRDCDVQYQESTTGCAFYVYQTFGVSFDNIYMERCWRGIYLDGGTISVQTLATYFNFYNVETDTQPKYGIILGRCSNVIINAYFENSKSSDIAIYCPDTTVTNRIVINEGTAYRNFTGTKYTSGLSSLESFKDLAEATGNIYQDTKFKKMLYVDGEMSSSRDYINITKPVRIKKSLRGTVNINNLLNTNDKILNFVTQNTTNFLLNIDVSVYNTANFSESMNAKFMVSGVIYNNANVVSLSKTRITDNGSLTGYLSIDTVTYNPTTHVIAVTIKNSYTGWTASKGIASCEMVSDEPLNIW